jgi:heptosyltransferase I
MSSTRFAKDFVAEPFLASPPESVLIIMLSALGDAVHVLPVANALRRAYPQTRISWVIQPVPHQLVRGHPAIHDFIVFRRRRGLDAWRSYADLQRAFQGQQYDLALALQVYFKAGLIAAMAPARHKLGFDRRRARDLNWLFTNKRIPARPVGHVQDQYFEFLDAIGVNPEPVEWRLELSDLEKAEQHAFFEKLSRPACAVVVATSKPQKNWTANAYAALLERIDADFGLQPVLVGGPSPIERETANQIKAASRARVIDALGDDVRRLVWLLQGSRLVISPDTGPLHIARALDVPVVGLYGYTNPKRYGPYRKFTDLVVDGYARSPSEPYAASMEHRDDGMKRITVDNVAAKVALALQKY